MLDMIHDLHGNAAGGSLASDQAIPGLSALTNDIHGVASYIICQLLVQQKGGGGGREKGKRCLRLVLAFASESKLILRLAVRDLVDTEPLICGTEETRQVTLDILDVVELACKGVVHIDNNDFPVGLILVQQGHDTENLDLLDLARVADKLTNLTDVKRIVVTLRFGLGVGNIGIFPGLEAC